MKIHTNTYVYLAVLLFLIPIRLIAAWIVAVICHEFFHYLAVNICGGKVFSLFIHIGGAKMACSSMTKKQQLISTLAGPVGGLLPTLFSRWFPEIALCCWLLSVYNLLPLLPLDGGHILQLLIKSTRLFFIQQRLCQILLLLLGLYLSFYKGYGILPAAVAIGLCVKSGKNPCNERLCRVQ